MTSQTSTEGGKPAGATRATAIRAQIEAVAPLPNFGPVTAAQLMKYMAVRAQERFTKLLHPGFDLAAEHQQIAAMGAEFACAAALFALAEEMPVVADDVAGQIWGAICDGGGIGEWLREILGEETSGHVAKLAAELADAIKAGATA